MGADINDHRTVTAQDYLDCVAGEYGPWWQNRANQFTEDNLTLLVLGSPALWELWAQVRLTEVPDA